MDMKKKMAIVGVGNCGSQVAFLAEQKYSELFDCVYINTSESDLNMVKCADESLKYKIGEAEVEGTGKNRSKMKEYLQVKIEEILMDDHLQETIKDKKYCFIVASAAGGTGSGAAPVLLEAMRQVFRDTHFVLVCVLPQIAASLMEQGNTIEFLEEVFDILGDNTTYMMYDNESTSGLPPTKALEAVNENIVEDIRVLSGVDNFATPYESIDEADMESIISTPGRLLVVRVKQGLTEKGMEDNDLDDVIIKAIKKSCHCETDRNKRVVRWGVITYFTDQVNALYTPDLPKLQEFIGTPVERFNHNATHDKAENLNFLYLIASGLSPINDRAKRITDRIEELKSALASDDASRYVLSGASSTYEAITARRKEERRSNEPKEIDIGNIFAKFRKDK